MVVSGARLDMGDPDAAIAALSGVGSGPVRTLLAARVVQARADALRAAGRGAEADEAEATVPAALLAQVQGADEDDDVVVFDLDEDDAEIADGELDGSDAADLDAAAPDAGSDDDTEDDDTPDTPHAAPAGDEDTEDE
jgi:hypothetical protein